MRRNKRKNKGFTLIELIMTVAILSFGIVSIYEALFISMDTYGFYTSYLNTSDWINEKIMETQEELRKAKVLRVEQASGQIVRGWKTYNWVMVTYLLNEEQSLYKVNVTLSWKEGGKTVSTSREAYVLPSELREFKNEEIV